MEEIKICKTEIVNQKEIELNDGGNEYVCSIQKDKNNLDIYLLNNCIIKYKGNIHISNIEYNLGIKDFNINDIFDEIFLLNKNKFNIKKESDKYELKIEFTILSKKRYLIIDLNEIKDDKNDMKIINELKEELKNKENKIKFLEEELNKYKKIINDNFNNEINDKKKEIQLNNNDNNSILENQKKDEEEKKIRKENEKPTFDLKNQNEILITKKCNKPLLITKEKKKRVNRPEELKFKKQIPFKLSNNYSFECTNTLNLIGNINFGELKFH